LIAYLDANADSLPNYGDRRRRGAAFSTAFVELKCTGFIGERLV
jgi:hypothetical protein